MMNTIARLTLISSLFVAAAGAAYAATTPVSSDAAVAPAAAVEADSLQAKRAALPREWRSERQARNFDGMFRAR